VSGPPLGLIFAGIGAALGVIVRLLGPPERLPIPLCVFKLLTGMPCPTCGGTRALYCLARFDLAGAVAMNPLASALAFCVGLWAVSDLLLLARGRSLRLGLAPSLLGAARVAAVVVAAANWVYLIAAGR
jgi:hypothetical protein